MNQRSVSVKDRRVVVRKLIEFVLRVVFGGGSRVGSGCGYIVVFVRRSDVEVERMDVVPPLLPSLAQELEEFLLHPELLPIHDIGVSQETWWDPPSYFLSSIRIKINV